MIKFVVFVVMIVATSVAQRAPYAGSPDRQRPPVHPQHLVTNSISMAGSGVAIGDRFGETGGSVAASGPSTNRYPYDPYNDPVLINHLQKLPVDKQPFWFVNRQAIANHVGKDSRRTTANVV